MIRPFLILFQLSLMAAFVVVWEALPGFGFVSKLLVPPPSDVIKASILVVSDPEAVPGGFWPNLQIYLIEIAISYLVVVVVGVTMGVLMGVYRLLGDVLEPILLAIYAVPHAIFYPIFILTLGVGSSSKVAYALLLALVVVIVTTLAGVRQLDKSYMKVARVMGASTGQLIRKVLLPALAPILLGSLQIGLAYTIIGVTVAEMVASSQGLGYLISWSTHLLKRDILYFIIVITIAIAFAINSTHEQIVRISRRR